MSACPAVSCCPTAVCHRKKKLFQFQRKISQKQIKSRAPESISTLLLSYNFECFLALKFPLRIFSLPPRKILFSLQNAHFRDPPSIPSGLIRCCQLRLEISPCGLRFAARIFLYPSSCAFYLGNAMKSACHSSRSPSRARARVYVQSVYMSC